MDIYIEDLGNVLEVVPGIQKARSKNIKGDFRNEK